jgi:hypothetical protein
VNSEIVRFASLFVLVRIAYRDAIATHFFIVAHKWVVII